MKDLTGQRFNRLVAIKPCGKTPSGNHKWIAQCDCGNTIVVTSGNLVQNHTQSCGCLFADKTSKSKKRYLNPRLYSILKNIKSRCLNPNHNSFKDYGGRGITICDEWLGRNGFTNFYNWATQNGYQDNLTIDRINVNGNYEPSNCRWITMANQQKNKRNNVLITFQGKTQNISDWSRELKIPRNTIDYRYTKGWSLEDVFKKD